jgi:quercetin dioxygenase-like cupin family protein/DNA-binding phage protein
MFLLDLKIVPDHLAAEIGKYSVISSVSGKKRLHFYKKYFIITVMDKASLKQIVPKIGQILKVFREKTKQNQGDIASKACISISMLSQIERGMVSPSIDTLVAVCAALGLEPSELFKRISSEKPVKIHHAGERLQMDQGGIRYEQLMASNHGGYQSEMFLIELAPGCKTMVSSDGHEGAEIGYVLKGKGVLTVDKTDYPVREGDSIFFTSNVPHQLHNESTETFSAVWSISPPHVDYLRTNDEHES